MTNEQKAFLYTGQSDYNIPRNVTHVKVDSSVKMIGEWAFSRSQLSIVELREGLEVIGKVAFHCCTSLERITIPSSVRVVGGRAFEGCTQLKIVKLCEGLERIDDSAFHSCTSLQRITIPSTVKVIGEWAFRCCTQLKFFEICEGLERIDAWAFDKCTSLQRITIPSTVKVIDKYAYRCCTQLKIVKLCEGLDRIDHSAFENCPSLEIINIPSTVKVIDKYAFCSCTGWDAIEFSNETEKFLMDVSLRKWLVDDARYYDLPLPQRYSLLARRSFPKRLGMIELTTGKMRIRDLLTRIPSIAFQDLDVHVDSIDKELDTYEKMQACIAASLEICGVGFIIPQVLSFL